MRFRQRLAHCRLTFQMRTAASSPHVATSQGSLLHQAAPDTSPLCPSSTSGSSPLPSTYTACTAYCCCLLACFWFNLPTARLRAGSSQGSYGVHLHVAWQGFRDSDDSYLSADWLERHNLPAKCRHFRRKNQI